MIQIWCKQVHNVRYYIKHDANKAHTSQTLQIQDYKSIIASNMMQTSPSTQTPHGDGHNGEDGRP